MIDHLPKNDTTMLVSSINFLLRDNEFDSLDDICSYFSEDRAEVEALAAAQGYTYSEELKKFY